MTDRQFGFLLKMASEGRGDSHFVVKLAAPGDHEAVLGSHGTAELERVRRERAANSAAKSKAIAERQAANRATYDARNPGWQEKARSNPRMRRGMGSMRPTASVGSVAPAATRSSAAPKPATPAAQQGYTPSPPPSARPVASSYDPKRYGDINYFNDRYNMYKDIATKYEANANAGKEKKKEGFNPGTVQNGAGFTPNRSNSLLDRMNALRAERERQAAEADTNGSATSAVNEDVARNSWNQRFPNGVPGPNPDVFSNDRNPAAQAAQNAAPGAAPMVGSSGRARRAGAYRQTPQMRAMSEEFARLPQRRQLDLLRSAGVDLGRYMNADPKTRDRMIMSAYEYARGQREQAAARRDAWRNAPGFVNGVKQIQPRRRSV